MRTESEFYKSTKWERKRQRILRRDGFNCQICKRYGKMRLASHVHHIYPLEEYPELAMQDWNLISLCNACHNRMHDRDTHLITAEGRQLQRRVERWKELNGRTDGRSNKVGSTV